MKRSYLVWGLFLSLGLNLFLAGTLAGRHFGKGARPEAPRHHETARGVGTPERGGPARADQGRKYPKGPHTEGHERRRGGSRAEQGPPTLRMLRGIAQTMGGKDDPRVQKILSSEREAQRAIRGKMRAARDALQEALLADPFDEAALNDAFATMSQQTQAAQEKAQGDIAKLISQMTPEEREALRDKFASFGRRKHGPSGKPDQPPE